MKNIHKHRVHENLYYSFIWMKSSRCVLILIYLTNYIVSVNTTNKFKFYCDMFRPHTAIIRLTKKCLWTLIITICLRAFEISNGLQFFLLHIILCVLGVRVCVCVCVCVCVSVSFRSFSLLASSVVRLNNLQLYVLKKTVSRLRSQMRVSRL